MNTVIFSVALVLVIAATNEMAKELADANIIRTTINSARYILRKEVFDPSWMDAEKWWGKQ